MEFTARLEQITSGSHLDKAQASEMISAIMNGDLTPAQTAALLIALKTKGETVEEIVGAAESMRRHAVPFASSQTGILDTCGTGGDRSGTFNLSTTTAFVAAGAGIPVAKHGNRSASSRCGSIDLLEQLGVNIQLDPARLGACLDAVGLCILFARVVHPAMRHAAPIRSELGVRTIFNWLGPLTNPARPAFQLVGIGTRTHLETYAQCLQQLGIQRAWVVASEDGLDEITLTGRTAVMEVTPDSITPHMLAPEDAGFSPCRLQELLGGAPEENARITLDLLEGNEKGPKRDTLLLNAGAAITIAGRAVTLQEGVEKARDSLESGQARRVLDRLIEFTHS